MPCKGTTRQRPFWRVIGIDGSESIAGFGPRRDQSGVCIVDEASMLGEAALPMVRKPLRNWFSLAIQDSLGPVGDVGVLGSVPGVHTHPDPPTGRG